MGRVIISQRVSAVMGADKILVLEHGRQVGMGTHDELLSSCAYYREIASTQLKGVER
jgi:ATP-binding cassette subfamily B protein